MKKIILCCIALFWALSPVVAQYTNPAPEKERVVVDLFFRCREMPMPYLGALRGQVLQAFADRGRHVIVDAESVRSLTESVPGTGIVTAFSAPSDMAAFLDLRAPEALALGARYLVTAAVTNYKFEHVMLPSSDGKPPHQGFKSTFRVVFSAIDLKLGERLPDAQYDLAAAAPVAEDADRAAIERVRSSIQFYVDTRFRFETQILQLCPADRKGRIRELYVHSGTQLGVRSGDLFAVYEEVPIGGVFTRMKVGRLRVVNVENGEIARCKITKGEQEIATAFLAKRPLICISDGQALF